MLNCSYKLFNSCSCAVRCESETAHIQIIIDRAPLIRPERQDIKTVIAFGVLVAMLAFGGAHVLNHLEIQYAMEARI